MVPHPIIICILLRLLKFPQPNLFLINVVRILRNMICRGIIAAIISPKYISLFAPLVYISLPLYFLNLDA
jgi:hypothetical protein